jgi:hypothetical protein
MSTRNLGSFQHGNLETWPMKKTPWKTTEIGEEIPVEIIKKYFVENYIEQ